MSITSMDFDELRFDSRKSAISLGPTITSIQDLADVQINEPLLDGQILKLVNGKWTNVDPQLLTNNFIEGYTKLSGNAYSTIFQIPHGFGATPTHVTVDPQSPEADEDFTISVDNVFITLTYNFPPPSGTNNLNYYYRVS